MVVVFASRLQTLLTDVNAVVPSEDSHQSEYIAPCDARRGNAVALLRMMPRLT